MAEDTSGHGGTSKPSDRSTRKSKDKKHKSKDEPVLGAMEAFGSLIYKVNSKDAAEMYQKTTEAIVDYVTTNYGKDMLNLVKYGEDRDFIPPPLPSEADRKKDKLFEVKWKAEYDEYIKDKKLYDLNKTQVFGIIKGQCSKMVRDELEKDARFKKIEMDSDVVGLVEILREMVHSNVGRKEPNWALVEVLKQVLSLHQQKNDSITHYYQRFSSAAQVLTTQWGPFYPPSQVEEIPERQSAARSARAAAGGDGSDEEESRSRPSTRTATDRQLAKAREETIQAAQEAMLTAIFLHNADKSRFSGLKERLNNDYLAGTDKYPKTLKDATTLLNYNQDSQVRSSKYKQGWGNDEERATSFAQTGKGKPKKGARSSNKTTNEDEEEHTRSTPRRGSSRSQAEGWAS